MGYEGKDWIHQAEDKDRWWALLDEVRNFRTPQNVEDFLTILELVSLSRRTLLFGVSKEVKHMYNMKLLCQ